MVKCDRVKPLDGDGYHLITCKYGAEPVWTHSTIVQTWSECLSELHVVHKIEPKHRFLDFDSRPDIYMYVVDPDSGKEVELDIPLAHPWALDTLPKAATQREMLKDAKYAKKARPCGTTLNFILLVMKHFGWWGQEAQKYLNNLSSTATWTTECRRDEFKNYWRTRFSIAMQQCNARVLLQKMSSFQYSGDSVGAISNSVSLLSTV